MIHHEIESRLKELRQKKQWIALSLYPGYGMSTIGEHGNRLFINEGRDGKFEQVEEKVYDQLVEKYDSRHRRRR